MRYVERVERIMTTLLTQNELELDIPIRDADIESAYDRAEQIAEYAERRARAKWKAAASDHSGGKEP